MFSNDPANISVKPSPVSKFSIAPSQKEPCPTNVTLSGSVTSFICTSLNTLYLIVVNVSGKVTLVIGAYEKLPLSINSRLVPKSTSAKLGISEKAPAPITLLWLRKTTLRRSVFWKDPGPIFTILCGKAISLIGLL